MADYKRSHQAPEAPQPKIVPTGAVRARELALEAEVAQLKNAMRTRKRARDCVIFGMLVEE